MADLVCFRKRGYIPLAMSPFGGISWRGQRLTDFWMWNKQYTEYKNGIRHIQTVRVAELKDAALRYWRDKWVPVRPVDDDFLRRMEEALRAHQGLKKDGVRLPEGPFLRLPEEIPAEWMGPDLREHLGLEQKERKRLERKATAPKKVLDAFRLTKLAEQCKATST